MQGTPSAITFPQPSSILTGRGVSTMDHSGLHSSVWENAGPGAQETEKYCTHYKLDQHLNVGILPKCCDPQQKIALGEIIISNVLRDR